MMPFAIYRILIVATTLLVSFFYHGLLSASIPVDAVTAAFQKYLIGWTNIGDFSDTSDAPRVKVLVCTEALCPDCKRFVLETLLQTYSTLGNEVMDLRMIPFGNAAIDKAKKTVECQHGLGECDANSYQQCLIAVFPEPHQYLPVMACLYEKLPMGRHNSKLSTDVFENCVQKANLDFTLVKACHDFSNIAWKLMESAADATPKEHDHVPWIEIDGTYMDEETQDFSTEICKAYIANGGSLPACNKILTLSRRRESRQLRH